MESGDVSVHDTLHIIINKLRQKSFGYVSAVADVENAQALFLVNDDFLFDLASPLLILNSHLMQRLSAIYHRRQHRTFSAPGISNGDDQVAILQIWDFFDDILLDPLQDLNQIGQIALHFLNLLLLQS